MGHALLFAEVIGSQAIEFLIFILVIIASFFSYRILQKWNYESTTPFQYSLENQNFLISLVVKSSFYIKLIFL